MPPPGDQQQLLPCSPKLFVGISQLLLTSDVRPMATNWIGSRPWRPSTPAKDVLPATSFRAQGRSPDLLHQLRATGAGHRLIQRMRVHHLDTRPANLYVFPGGHEAAVIITT